MSSLEREEIWVLGYHEHNDEYIMIWFYGRRKRVENGQKERRTQPYNTSGVPEMTTTHSQNDTVGI